MDRLQNPAGLRAWRRARGLTQKQLAEMLHVHPDTIRFHENGRYKISYVMVLALKYLELKEKR